MSTNERKVVLLSQSLGYIYVGTVVPYRRVNRKSLADFLNNAGDTHPGDAYSHSNDLIYIADAHIISLRSFAIFRKGSFYVPTHQIGLAYDNQKMFKGDPHLVEQYNRENQKVEEPRTRGTFILPDQIVVQGASYKRKVSFQKEDFINVAEATLEGTIQVVIRDEIKSYPIRNFLEKVAYPPMDYFTVNRTMSTYQAID